jgi:fumarate hydratase subunit beta
MIKLTTPISNEEIKNLRIGDVVAITGTIFTARDAAHARLAELVKNQLTLPFNPKNAVVYYVGPTPPKPGQVIGSCGPTSSYRMDPYSSVLMKQGLKIMIGKGQRSEEFKAEMRKCQGVYLSAVGGTGALISKTVIQSVLIAYPDLGPEGIYQLTVKDFPAVVTYDAVGGDLFQEGQKKYRRSN